MALVRTRFAPSPSGDLHLGSVAAALVSWCRGGTRLLRIEDLDTPRVMPGCSQRQMEDLMWLGLGWDEGPGDVGQGAPYTQSECTGLYAGALQNLKGAGLVYPCDCSRTEIAAVSAPHAGEELTYPGTCRDKAPQREFRRPPAWRLRIEHGAMEHFDDLRLGPHNEQVAAASGDFVLQRGDGVFTYQFACAVDDGRSRVSDVVRGEDLLGSTARQRYLQACLGLPRPTTYVHIPTILGADGSRLAKRHGAPSVRSMRESGVPPEAVLGQVAYLLGLQDTAAPKRPDAWLACTPPRVVRRRVVATS